MTQDPDAQAESGDAPILWTPSPERAAASEMARFLRWLEESGRGSFADYDALWRWSIADAEGFWLAVAAFFDLRFSTPPSRALGSDAMPGADWFPGATLNYTDQLFRWAEAEPDRIAIRWRRETGRGTLTRAEFAARAGALSRRLAALGVGEGDRVVAILPNGPESLIAFAAAASLGAIWSLCSPDMGLAAVVDRFKQIEPKVLIAANGYVHNGREVDRVAFAQEVIEALPTLEKVVSAQILGGAPALPDSDDFEAMTAADGGGAPATVQVPFSAPLWVVYSSGTTGNPKPIVHSHGGILLEAMKFTLHADLKEDDVFQWLTASGWIMWNTQLVALLKGCGLTLFDGAPNTPDMGEVWRFAGETGVTYFGAGAAYFTACMKDGVKPTEVADLSAIRSVSSTGSPLPPEAYDWIYAHVSPDCWLAPISGGTDLAGAFVGGCPLLPVRAGEMQCRWLGMAVEAWDEAGNRLDDAVGELVCTRPTPAMPLYFWGDADGSRLHESYFDTYPGVWRHGDWIRIAPSGGSVIYGRSDATINRRGLRLGSSEIYRAVEGLDEVVD
ncbi:MAG: acetoacetate--CoA ligase, partial [Pseudomonadota bacterium]